MTGKSKVTRPVGGTNWPGRMWLHECLRPGCENEPTAATCHWTWQSAMGMVWTHLRHFHRDA